MRKHILPVILFLIAALLAANVGLQVFKNRQDTAPQVKGTYYKFNVTLTQYTVKPGDCLWTIANNQNTTVQTIQQINNMGDRTTILVGQKITVPGTVTVQVVNQTPATPPSNSVPIPKPTNPAPQPVPAPQPNPIPQPNSGDNSTSYSNFVTDIQRLVNAERAKAGLAPLTIDANLTKVAQVKAVDMAANGYFDHNSPTYGSPFDMMRKYGVKFSYAGENIAKGYASPEAVMQGWMNSSGHRANILNPNYTHIGIGMKDRNWVQMFIKG